jgi:ribosomal protein S18 acetylase RimI-like enzyme
MENGIIVPYANKYRTSIFSILKVIGWTPSQINGQLEFINGLSSTKNAWVFVFLLNTQVVAYVSFKIHSWNNLAHIQGLVVDPTQRRKSIATQLLVEVEKYIRSKKVRGMYVDTPVDNEAARKLYEAFGFTQDYVMTEYYGKGQDGVTYLKLYEY